MARRTGNVFPGIPQQPQKRRTLLPRTDSGAVNFILSLGERLRAISKSRGSERGSFVRPIRTERDRGGGGMPITRGTIGTPEAPVEEQEKQKHTVGARPAFTDFGSGDAPPPPPPPDDDDDDDDLDTPGQSDDELFAESRDFLEENEKRRQAIINESVSRHVDTTGGGPQAFTPGTGLATTTIPGTNVPATEPDTPVEPQTEEDEEGITFIPDETNPLTGKFGTKKKKAS